MEEVKNVIREFILSTHLPGEATDNLHDDTALLSSGILDSLAVLGLASFLEERFRVQLSVFDLGVERFDCIADIAAVVADARQPGAKAGVGGP